MEEQCLFIGPVFHSETKHKLSVIEKAAILVENGKIKALETSGNLSNIKSLIQDDCKTINLENGQFLCPGLVDTHVHAAQYPNIGLGYDKELLDWLKTYTFPLEKKYSNMKFANEVYSSVVKATLLCGTTTACYYATIHTESAIELAHIASKLGQRAIIGKVNMNQNSMDDYVEETGESLRKTEHFIQEVKALNNPLVQPGVTPRFAIACDMELMKGLSKLAKKYDCHIQTHISENKSEIDFVKELFPDSSSYTDVYDQAGLLTEKTILGHGIYLSDVEKATLSRKGTSIAHCPNSNIMLRSGMCDVKSLWKSNVKVGLGTDVSGGCNPSILDAMRNAISTSIHLSFTNSDYEPLTYHEAFYLATIGGAEAANMEESIGNFKVGKDFDALLIDMSNSKTCGVLPEHTFDELIQKFIYVGNETNIKDIYVKGKLVKV